MTNPKFRNTLIAAAVAGAVWFALAFAQTSTRDLDFGTTTYVLPMVLFGGLLTGLNARAGNRRVPLASAARKAELLGFPPAPGHGWIAVMREKASWGGAVGADLSVDDAMVAQLMPKRFTLISLPAGPHQLFADIPEAPGPSAFPPLAIELREGEVQIYAIRAAMAVFRTSLRLDPVADTPAGRAALARLALVEPAESRQ